MRENTAFSPMGFVMPGKTLYIVLEDAREMEGFINNFNNKVLQTKGFFYVGAICRYLS